MPTYALTIDAAESSADDLAGLLLAEGAAGAEIRDASVAPMPGASRPPPGRAQVIAFFGSQAEAERAAGALGSSGAVSEVPDEDWGESWKRGLGPSLVGCVFIRPSFAEAAPPAGTVEVVLDPGMAFGTGSHPTTALCLSAVCDLLRDQPGAGVLDVGTGSGLLAIAAHKLGARRVVGTENDPEALRVAGENARRNGVGIELRLEEPDAVGGQFELVVANILANTLVDLAPALSRRLRPGGTMLLSGLLADQEAGVLETYVAEGLERLDPRCRREGEWILLALTKALPAARERSGDDAGRGTGDEPRTARA